MASIEDAEEALRLRPRCPKTNLTCASSNEANNNLKQAVACYRRAAELDPSLVDEIEEPLARCVLKLSHKYCTVIFSTPEPSPAIAIYGAALSPCNPILAAAYADGAVRLWDTTLLQTLSGHSEAATTVAWSSDGDYLASGSLDTTARLWKRSSSNNNNFTFISVLKGHSGRVSDIVLSKDTGSSAGIKVVTASTDLTIKVWDGISGVCLFTLVGGHSSLVTSIALHHDILASASGDAQFKVWNIKDGACLENVAWDSGPVVLCGFLPCSSSSSSSTRISTVKPLLLTAHAQLARQESRVLLWDVVEKKDGCVDGRLVAPAWSIDDGLVGRPTSWDSIVVSSSSVDIDECRLLAVACADGIVRVWDITERPFALFSHHVGDRSRGAAASYQPAWKAAALQSNSSCKNVVKLSPQGLLLAASGAANVIHIIDVDTGSEVCCLAGHSGTIRALEWLMDGTEVDQQRCFILMSCAENGEIRQWTLPVQ